MECPGRGQGRPQYPLILLMTKLIHSKTVFSTPWFKLLAKRVDQEADPYYSLQTADYVSIVAVTNKGRVLLVRQYRPAVERMTLELPSGHVDGGMTPEDAAKQELLEETGYLARQVELLGCICPDTGRLANRMWCFFASGVTRSEVPHVMEPGIELTDCTPEELMDYILEFKFDHALHLAAVLLAILKGKIPGKPAWV